MAKVSLTLQSKIHKAWLRYSTLKDIIVIDVGFDMSDNRSDGDRCNKKGHKTRELSQQV